MRIEVKVLDEAKEVSVKCGKSVEERLAEKLVMGRFL